MKEEMEVKPEPDELPEEMRDNKVGVLSGTEVITVAPTEPQMPTKPKKHKGAYRLFADDHREQIESGDDSESEYISDIGDHESKRLRLLWENADTETKEKYKLQAAMAKAKYADEMEEYNKAIDAICESPYPKKRRRSDVDYSELNDGPELEEDEEELLVAWKEPQVEEQMSTQPGASKKRCRPVVDFVRQNSKLSGSASFFPEETFAAPTKPKPPKDAFSIFADEHLAFSTHFQSRILWRNASADTWEKYKIKAEEAKAKHAAELEEYEAATKRYIEKLESFQKQRRRPVVDYSNLCRPAGKLSGGKMGRHSRKEFVVKMEMSDAEYDDVKMELAEDNEIKVEEDDDDDIKKEIKVEIKEE